MKRIFSKITVLLIFSLQSCDCVTEINGYIIDSKTKEPIENVSISLVTKNFTKNDFGIIKDSINISERKQIIATQGNKDMWEETGEENMIRHIPLETDSNGFFEVFWFTGFCPKYELKLSKEGYKTLLLESKEISNDTMIFELNKI